MLFLFRIIFFARGNADTRESACFAFTAVADGGGGGGDGSGGGGGEDKTTQQQHHKFETHAFRCQVPEAVSKVFVSFAQVKILNGCFYGAVIVAVLPAVPYRNHPQLHFFSRSKTRLRIRFDNVIPDLPRPSRGAPTRPPPSPGRRTSRSRRPSCSSSRWRSGRGTSPPPPPPPPRSRRRTRPSRRCPGRRACSNSGWSP